MSSIKCAGFSSLTSSRSTRLSTILRAASIFGCISIALFSNAHANAQVLVAGDTDSGTLRFYNATNGSIIHSISSANQGGIALGSDGYIYSSFGSSILKINQTDYSVSTFATGAGTNSYDLHFDSHDNLWTNQVGAGLVSYDTSGNRTQSSIFTYSFTQGNLRDYTQFGIDANDNFYFSQYGNGTNDILEYSAAGTLLNSFGSFRPTDFNFDSSGNLYAANGNSGVTEYSSTGSFVKTITGGGHSISSFALDGTGGMFTNHQNHGSEIGYINSSNQFSTIVNLAGPATQMIFEASSVPEPGAIALGVGSISLGGLAFLRKRRHSRS